MVSELTQEYLEIVEEAIYITKSYESDYSDNYKEHVMDVQSYLVKFIKKIWKKLSVDDQLELTRMDFTGKDYSFDELTFMLCSYAPMAYRLLEKEDFDNIFCGMLLKTSFNLEKVIKQW